MSLIANSGGRKFIVTATTGFALCLLVWFGKIDGPVFRDVMIAIVAVYVAGNVVESIKVPVSKAAAARKDA